MMRKPEMASSTMDTMVPSRSWTLEELLRKVRPIPPMITAEKRMRINTKPVRTGLTYSMNIKLRVMMMGSRKMDSSAFRMLHSISCTSAVIRDMRSPLRSSEK